MANGFTEEVTSFSGDFEWTSDSRIKFTLKSESTQLFVIRLAGFSDVYSTIDDQYAEVVVVDPGDHELRIAGTVNRKFKSEEPTTEF